MSPIRCLVADDESFMREGLADAVNAAPDLELVGAVAHLDAVLNHPGPVDVVLLDLSLRRSCRRRAIPSVRSAHPKARVLVITAYATGRDVVQAFGEGAAGYFAKGAPSDELLAALRTVAARRTYCPPTLAGNLLNAGLSLTEHESALLRCLAAGMTAAQAAGSLQISPDMVELRMADVRQKAVASAPRFTRGEIAALRCVAEGMTDKEAAEALGITARAVEHRLSKARRKAGIRDRSRSNLTRLAMDVDPFCPLCATEHAAEGRTLA